MAGGCWDAEGFASIPASAVTWIAGLGILSDPSPRRNPDPHEASPRTGRTRVTVSVQARLAVREIYAITRLTTIVARFKYEARGFVAISMLIWCRHRSRRRGYVGVVLARLATPGFSSFARRKRAEALDRGQLAAPSSSPEPL